MAKIVQWIRNGLKYMEAGGVVKVELNMQATNRYEGKTVLITGGTSGIGLAMAKKYIFEGAYVIITGRSQEKLEKAKREISKTIMIKKANSETSQNEEVKIETYQWDLLETNWDIHIKEIFDRYGDIDIIIHNAGIYDTNPYMKTEKKSFDTVITTNLKAPYFISQAYIKELVERGVCQKKHNMLFIVSNRSLLKDTNVYGISKSGLLCFVKGLSVEACKYNVVVNGISPGMTASNINHIDVTDNAYNANIPDTRIAAAEEVAELGAFMTSDAAAHMIGEVVVIDGGETL